MKEDFGSKAQTKMTEVAKTWERKLGEEKTGLERIRKAEAEKARKRENDRVIEEKVVLSAGYHDL